MHQFDSGWNGKKQKPQTLFVEFYNKITLTSPYLFKVAATRQKKDSVDY